MSVIYIIYKNNDDNFYLGKTNNLHLRIANHKHNCKINLNRKIYNYINDNGGFDKWNYKIISEDQNETESKWYHILKPTLNTNVCGRDFNEWYSENKDYYRNWRLKNPDYMTNYGRKYRQSKKKQYENADVSF